MASKEASADLESFLNSKSPNAIKSHIDSLSQALSHANEEKLHLLKQMQTNAFIEASTRAELDQCRSELLAVQATLKEAT